VAPEPTAEIQHQVPRTNTEAVVVDGQHGLGDSDNAEEVGAPGSGRPSSIAL
jgi:hypothetical protein